MKAFSAGGYQPEAYTRCFLQALTDPGANDLGDRVPSSVPSGLPVGG